jgi:hypothetical protein
MLPLEELAVMLAPFDPPAMPPTALAPWTLPEVLEPDMEAGGR